ncbi:hypothetical protein B0T09DRAFT_17474 [Sordaria sp. MPI-SDFR-AT-0083]|nr:hypothetical protein B0T09DRAFT_17474 [Sordaria sp. MPI-SDFR-AT-0083]
MCISVSRARRVSLFFGMIVVGAVVPSGPVVGVVVCLSESSVGVVVRRRRCQGQGMYRQSRRIVVGCSKITHCLGKQS